MHPMLLANNKTSLADHQLLVLRFDRAIRTHRFNQETSWGGYSNPAPGPPIPEYLRANTYVLRYDIEVSQSEKRQK